MVNSVLKIHLHWNGRGTCRIPYEGAYGPLVSAIRGITVHILHDVHYHFCFMGKTLADKDEMLNFVQFFAPKAQTTAPHRRGQCLRRMMMLSEEEWLQALQPCV